MNPKTKKFQTKFHVLTCKKEKVRVCQKAFLNILVIKKYRVQYIMRTFFNTGKVAEEKRGGYHVSHKYKERLDSVKKFINKFKVSEAHYCRGSSK